MIRTVLTPFAKLYGQVMTVRNSLYDNQTLQVSKLSIPVVSVGNITVGGTGKTPFVLELLEWAKAQKLSTGVISRGYKSASSQPRRVDVDKIDAPHLFGDEPTLIAMKNLQAPVYVGSNRVEVGQKLLAENQVQLIVADDAFQHRRLGRDIDVVLIDALGDFANDKVLPAGRLREPREGLRRADFVVITRANLISSSRLENLKKQIQAYGFNDENIIEDRLEIKSCFEIQFPDIRRLEVEIDKIPQPVVLISGIGQPKSFELLLEKNNIKFIKHFSFPDHHGFTEQDIEAIADSQEAKNARAFLTTEKDIVKLTELKLTTEDWAGLRVCVVEVKSSYSENIRNLHDAVISLAR